MLTTGAVHHEQDTFPSRGGGGRWYPLWTCLADPPHECPCGSGAFKGVMPLTAWQWRTKSKSHLPVRVRRWSHGHAVRKSGVSLMNPTAWRTHSFTPLSADCACTCTCQIEHLRKPAATQLQMYLQCHVMAASHGGNTSNVTLRSVTRRLLRRNYLQFCVLPILTLCWQVTTQPLKPLTKASRGRFK